MVALALMLVQGITLQQVIMIDMHVLQDIIVVQQQIQLQQEMGNAQLVIMQAQLGKQQLHAMGNVLQVITVLLVQQEQHKMYVVHESIVQLEALVQLTALLGIMGAQLQIQ